MEFILNINSLAGVVWTILNLKQHYKNICVAVYVMFLSTM